MQFRFISSFIFFFTTQVVTTPLGPDIASGGVVHSNQSTTINATIFDHAGHDITSSFQIRLYSPGASRTNYVNNSLSNRQVEFSRPINECPGKGGFRESFCTPESSIAGSLQRYTIVCRDTYVMMEGSEYPIQDEDYLTYAAIVGGRPRSRQETVRRDGHCNNDEICVSGLGILASHAGKRMASCVRTEFFIQYIHAGKNSQTVLDLEGKMASMVVSQQDGTTPTEVDTLEADTQTAGSVQANRCRDCTELTTKPFAANTNNLEFQTKLLTTGGMAGVLWLAIASG